MTQTSISRKNLRGLFGIGKYQQDYFSPLGALLAGLFTKLAWAFPDMRNLEEYFRIVNLSGAGQGASRKWDISIYSDNVREQLQNQTVKQGKVLDEWNLILF